jgi:copper(I)-binding protein
MKKFISVILLSLAATSATAEISIKNAWVRQTVQGQKVTGAFMQIHSDTNIKLIGGSSKLAESCEIHQMKMEGDVMKMRQIDELNIQAGKPLELKPGSFHLMLINLHSAVLEGSDFPLELQFEDAAGKKSVVKVTAKGLPMANTKNTETHNQH